jgi:SAM-dependent methyltransferase
VVGGGSVGEGSASLSALSAARIVSFDVYGSPDTTFVADAHLIPLADASVDVVWVQAVLEHVLERSVVAGEIGRVLGVGGVLYADTPVLQPVHEGPHDFTRFTQSGHRLLFGQFDEIGSYPLGGPGALYALAVRGLVGGLARSHSAAKAAYALSAWLSHMDRLVHDAWRSDFATGVAFSVCAAKVRRRNSMPWRSIAAPSESNMEDQCTYS